MLMVGVHLYRKYGNIGDERSVMKNSLNNKMIIITAVEATFMSKKWAIQKRGLA